MSLNFWDGITVILLALLKIELALHRLHALGFSFWTSVSVTLLWSNLVLTVIYYFAGVVKALVNWFVDIAVNNNNRDWVDWVWLIKVKTPLKEKRKEFLEWIIRHNRLLLFLIIAVPYIPFVDNIAIAAARIGKIKHGFWIAVLSNSFKLFMVAVAVWF
jgi:hypothetical protein